MLEEGGGWLHSDVKHIKIFDHTEAGYAKHWQFYDLQLMELWCIVVGKHSDNQPTQIPPHDVDPKGYFMLVPEHDT